MHLDAERVDLDAHRRRACGPSAPAGARRAPGTARHPGCAAPAGPRGAPRRRGHRSEHLGAARGRSSRVRASSRAPRSPVTVAIRAAGGRWACGTLARTHVGRSRSGPTAPGPAARGGRGRPRPRRVPRGARVPAALSQRRSASSDGPHVVARQGQPRVEDHARRRSRRRRPARPRRWRRRGRHDRRPASTTRSPLELRTVVPGNIRPSSSAVRASPRTGRPQAAVSARRGTPRRTRRGRTSGTCGGAAGPEQARAGRCRSGSGRVSGTARTPATGRSRRGASARAPDRSRGRDGSRRRPPAGCGCRRHGPRRRPPRPGPGGAAHRAAVASSWAHPEATSCCGLGGAGERHPASAAVSCCSARSSRTSRVCG